MSALQQTLKASIHCRGIGLHSGAHVNMMLHPALPGTGIVFRRADRGGAEIPASWRNIVDSTLCTTLGNRDGLTVATVEHLMSALAGLEIDNAVVEIDGPEVPVMDGSAAPFVFLIECAGIVEQPAPRRAIKVLKRVSVGTPGNSASLVSDDSLRFSFAIDFASGAISRQELSFSLDSDEFQARNQPRAHLRLPRRYQSDARGRPGARRLARKRCRDQRRPRAEPRKACATATSSCGTRCLTRSATFTSPAGHCSGISTACARATRPTASSSKRCSPIRRQLALRHPPPSAVLGRSAAAGPRVRSPCPWPSCAISSAVECHACGRARVYDAFAIALCIFSRSPGCWRLPPARQRRKTAISSGRSRPATTMRWISCSREITRTRPRLSTMSSSSIPIRSGRPRHSS